MEGQIKVKGIFLQNISVYKFRIGEGFETDEMVENRRQTQ